MSEWNEFKLGDIALIVDCEHKTAPLVELSDFVSVRTANISKGKIDYDNCNRVSKETYEIWTKRMKPQKGDIVLAREAPVGEVGVIKDDWKVCLGQRTVLIRANGELINPMYLLYYLTNNETKYDLIGHSAGSVVEHLNVKDIRNFDLKVCSSILEQTSIASILSSLDDKIDLLHRQNKTSEQLAETIFRQWFVEEVDEELVFFSNYFNLLMGQSPLSDSYNENKEGVPLLNGAADYSNGEYITNRYTTSPTRINKKGDLIFCVRATIGNIEFAEREFCLGRGVAALNPKEYENVYYIFFQLKYIIDELINNASGSVILGLTKDDLLNHQINKPTEKKLQLFNELAKPLFNKISINKNQIRTLIQLRDTLLPKLISGEAKMI